MLRGFFLLGVLFCGVAHTAAFAQSAEDYTLTVEASPAVQDGLTLPSTHVWGQTPTPEGMVMPLTVSVDILQTKRIQWNNVVVRNPWCLE